jgi:hypothetical protein
MVPAKRLHFAASLRRSAALRSSYMRKLVPVAKCAPHVPAAVACSASDERPTASTGHRLNARNP